MQQKFNIHLLLPFLSSRLSILTVWRIGSKNPTYAPHRTPCNAMLQGKYSVSLIMNVILVYQNALMLLVCSKRKGCSYAQCKCLDTALSHGILAIYHKPPRCLIAIINWLPTYSSKYKCFVIQLVYGLIYCTTAVSQSAFRAQTTQFIIQIIMGGLGGLSPEC